MSELITVVLVTGFFAVGYASPTIVGALLDRREARSKA
jgi:hypothetical protein